MKLSKVFLAILILFSTFQICFGQEEKPKPELIDEFSNINCEFLLAKLDYFFTALQNNPTATGYIIIAEKKENNRQSFRFRGMIRGYTRFRRFDSSRLTLIRSEESKNLKVQFWSVPAGADLPVSSNLSWDSPFSISKPEMFYSENDADTICPGDGLIRFSEILAKQTDLRAHFVINAKSIKAFNERKKELFDEFKEIPANRLKFFYVRNNSDTYVEYWLVPPKRK